MANTLVHKAQGGATLTIDSGGSLALGAGVTLTVSGTNVIVSGLPTSDPSVAGALWSNTGVLTVSAG